MAIWLRRGLLVGLMALHGLVTVGGTSLHALLDGHPHRHAAGHAHDHAAGRSRDHAAARSSAGCRHGCGHKHAASHESPTPAASEPRAGAARPAHETAAHDCPVCVCWSVFSAQVRLAEEQAARWSLPCLVERVRAAQSRAEFSSGRRLLPPVRGPPLGGCA